MLAHRSHYAPMTISSLMIEMNDASFDELKGRKYELNLTKANL